MKSISGVVIVSLVLALTADAATYVTVGQWRSRGGFYMTDPMVGLLSPGQSALAQLIFSPDGTADGAYASTSHNLDLSGNDVWLADYTVAYSAGDFGYALFNAPEYFATSSPGTGYIYARIFQDTAADVLDKYYAGPLVSVSSYAYDSANPKPPTVYDINTDNVNGNALDQTVMAQVIPEPGTLALLGLGVLTLIGRRIRGRK